MHRRAFIANLASAIILPRAVHAQTSAATPIVASGRPNPIDVGSGVSLIDRRIHPGDTVGIIGELRNDTDRMIDAPVVSITWPREGRSDGFAWLSPIIPVIEAGGTVPVYGKVPPGEVAATMLANPTFALCSPAEPGEYANMASAMEFEITPVDEVTSPEVYRLKGTMTITSASTVRQIELRGILRDADGRIAGMANSIYYSALVAGRAYAFSIYAYADPQYSNRLNPFPLLDGTEYTAEVVAGPRGPITMPGCSFGMPWE